ncbi:cysteine dioxygenase [Streptomyces sulfonofaciens]|uniref:Cysteine dioxygenase n=1 Tax=Streptomyces sulfonofaciens TaxID=68272 RepID=A0A919G7W0_9ACTN|nr:cysteine dioxygenase family protein [Streptomyces sulfonofaciens]GHH79807.1 cysteine dioxygenase [Streptomyces sulfonofaciens]
MNSDSDLQIAGDLLEVLHLLGPAPEHPSTVAEFAGLAREVAADPAQWRHLVRYDTTTRWYHRLRTGPGYEMWLLTWVPGQGSGTHDHGPSCGVLTVLEGALTEHTRRGAHTLTAGAQRVFAPGYVHGVVNDSLEPAVSLHIYHPGLTEMPVRSARRATRHHPAPHRTTAPDESTGPTGPTDPVTATSP